MGEESERGGGVLARHLHCVYSKHRGLDAWLCVSASSWDLSVESEPTGLGILVQWSRAESKRQEGKAPGAAHISPSLFKPSNTAHSVRLCFLHQGIS